MTLSETLKERALELGFVRAGVARAEPLEPEGARLRAWIADGRHGAMGYMAQTAEVRGDPTHERMLPGARSVLVVVAPYARAHAAVGPEPGVVARYARGRDYHNVLHKRLRKLVRVVREHGHEARASVDSMPVLERAWAARAGVGFIGKNCCLIVPGVGSHVFLAAVVTTAELEPDTPIAERCGSCTLCLEACPTRAFVAPRELDARRCISYLTIEDDGPVPEALRSSLGTWIFGCDVCQDVCPFNRTSLPPDDATAPFEPDARWARRDAASLLAMTEEQFRAYAAASPIQRAGRAGMARNAAIVLGNAGGKRHLAVLREAAAAHDQGVVRDAAAWAVRRIEEREP